MSPKDSKSVGQRQRRFKPQPLVSTLVKDPKHPPRLRMLRGYLGESSEGKNHLRIYLDVELRRYLDVPAEGVVHTESAPENFMPFGAVFVWVREDLPIRHHGWWPASEDPSTMATGEEGDPDPTTMATGEESVGFENPLNLVINPFGRY